MDDPGPRRLTGCLTAFWFWTEMTMRNCALFLVGLSFVVLTSCGGGEKQPPGGAPSTPAQVPQPTPAAKPAVAAQPAAAPAGGGVKAKRAKDAASDKVARTEKGAANRLAKDRKLRDADGLKADLKGECAKADALEGKMKAQIEVVAKASDDAKAGEACDKMEAEFEALAKALDALEACDWDEEDLEAAADALAAEVDDVDELAESLEELAAELEDEDLFDAVDALDELAFEMRLVVDHIDDLLDEADGTIGDDIDIGAIR